MKRLSFVLVALLATAFGNEAWASAVNYEYDSEVFSVVPDSTDEVLEVVETQPQFPNGMQALMQFMSQNLVYPEAARKAGIQGRVIVQFVIDKDGSVIEPQITKSVNEELDAEAIRVIKLLPKWSPGMTGGQPVRVRFTLPVTFRLPDDKDVKKPAGQMPPQMGRPMGRMGGNRTTAVFGMYKKGKNRAGFDEYMFGIKDKMHQTYKVTINMNVKTQNDELQKEIAQRVFGVRGDFETALKSFRKSLDEIKIEEAKITIVENETEYGISPNGVVGIEYRSLANVTNMQKLPAVEYFLFDTNTNKVVTLSELIAPSLKEYLTSKGVDTEKSTNICMKDNGFIAVTSLSVITMDGVKLKDKLSDYALEILGMTR